MQSEKCKVQSAKWEETFVGDSILEHYSRSGEAWSDASHAIWLFALLTLHYFPKSRRPRVPILQSERSIRRFIRQHFGILVFRTAGFAHSQLTHLSIEI